MGNSGISSDMPFPSLGRVVLLKVARTNEDRDIIICL
jgi:hypothetical protein